MVRNSQAARRLQSSGERKKRPFPWWLTMVGIDLKAVVRGSQHEVRHWPEADWRLRTIAGD